MTRETAIEEIKNYENYPNGLSKECRDYIIKALEQEPKTEWEQDHAILQAYSDGANEVLDKIRAEIVEYGSLWVEYKIEGHSDRDIEKIVETVLKQAKQQVLQTIDKYRQEG